MKKREKTKTPTTIEFIFSQAYSSLFYLQCLELCRVSADVLLKTVGLGLSCFFLLLLS